MTTVLAVATVLLWGVFPWGDGTKQPPSDAEEPAAGIIHAGDPSPVASLPKMRRGRTSEQPEPMSEGWESEAVAAEITGQLQRVSRLLVDPSTIDPQVLGELAADEFTCTPLLPRRLEVVFRDPAITVERPVESTATTKDHPDDAERRVGAAGLAESLRELAGPLKGAGDVYAKFKLIGLEQQPDGIVTNVFLQTSGHRPDESIQQNARWRVRWSRREGQTPRLVSIDAGRHEQVTARVSSGRLFTDATGEVFAGTSVLGDQFAQGIDYWQARIERRMGIYQFGHHGLALGDANGDGRDDLYLCQPGGLPNRLLLQNPNGTLRDVSAAAGVDALDATRSALFVDLDNDGRQDLVVSTAAALLVFAGDGTGGFQRRASLQNCRGAYSLAAADYDADGDLDLYCCTYYRHDDDAGGFPIAVPYHDANNGGPNVLLANDGQWNFHDATAEAGLDENNRRFSFAAAWEDYDGDGDADLYVANDFGRNNLYRNERGRFRDVAAAAKVEDIASGMSACWGDYDRDGRADLYVGNMFSAAGSRVAYQRRFHQGASADLRAQFQRLARGNSLFSAAADGTFRDVSVEAGVTMGRWAWGSLFADINADGWEDLLVVNGYLTGSRADDL